MLNIQYYDNAIVLFNGSAMQLTEELKKGWNPISLYFPVNIIFLPNDKLDLKGAGLLKVSDQ